MCGISGIISPDQQQHQQLSNMLKALEHRGPDGTSSWCSPQQQVSLGHNRLAIIDITKYGEQPMHYLGRYSIVHNGEIYNYKELDVYKL